MYEIFKPKFSQDTKYAYSVGRVRGMEVRLMTSQQIERLIETETANEFINELNETGYKKYIQFLSPDSDFEIILLTILKDFMKELGNLCSDKDIFYALSLPFDIHNLKLILKRYLAGENFKDNNYISLGNYPVELFEDLLKEKRYDEIPVDFQDSVNAIIKDYSASENINIVDIFLDKLLYNRWIVIGKYLGIEYLVNLARISIDMANFGMLLRIKGFNRNPRLLRISLIENGFFPNEYLIDLFDNDFKVIVQLLNEDPYRKPFIGIEDNMTVIDVIERFEVNAKHLILEYCKLANYVSFGVEPLIALYIRKNEELRILRTIYLGRKNNFSNEQIKKLL